MGQVTLITTLLKVINHPYVAGVSIAYLCTNYDNASFCRSRDMVGDYHTTTLCFDVHIVSLMC